MGIQRARGGWTGSDIFSRRTAPLVLALALVFAFVLAFVLGGAACGDAPLADPEDDAARSDAPGTRDAARPPDGAAGERKDFTFRGARCAQNVQNLAVPAARVRPYLDPRFRCSREEAGTCMISYRLHRCRDLSLDGGEPTEVIWADLGVRVRPPHGVPNHDHVDNHAVDGHDYYQLLFHTNSPRLAQRFAGLGAPARLVTAMSFQQALDGHPLPFAGVDDSPVDGRYTVDGTRPLGHTLADEEALLVTELLDDVFPPFHLATYHANRDGSIVRHVEHRTTVGGYFARYALWFSDDTLMKKLVAPDDDRTRSRSPTSS